MARSPARSRRYRSRRSWAVNDVSERALLPSFLYLPSSREFPPGALDLPWKSPPDRLVGTFAREHGAKVPGRLIGSAKSWLSHPGVDRRSPILPWTAAEDVARVSPVTASASYLEHLREAWNARFGGKKAEERLENQEVLLTVPASFDAVARELTMEAAGKAGLKQVTLLEEPQAAFYAWLAIQGEKWRKQVKVGDIILVCDVGGGTTDFTLISVADEGGDLILSRLAVGEHILLGGDNMDLALAYAVAATLPQGMEGLDATQRVALGYACRTAKETLFAEPKKSAAPVTVLGRGSKVIGGTIKTELTRELLNTSLLDGFLPRCAATDLPLRGRRVGLTEIGLPYAADPAITRHLARFLGQQAGSLHTGRGDDPSFSGAIQRRRLQGDRASPARARRPCRLGEQARARAALVRPGSRRGPGRRVLRPGPPRPGRADSRRRGPVVLRRPGNLDAGRPRRSAANQGPLRRAYGHGGRHRGRRPQLRAWPGRRRAGRLPLPQLHDPPRRPRGHRPRSLEPRRNPGACPPRNGPRR